MLNISTTLSGMISHAELFLLASCGTLGRRSRNPRVPRNPGWKSLLYTLHKDSAGVEVIYIPEVNADAKLATTNTEFRWY